MRAPSSIPRPAMLAFRARVAGALAAAITVSSVTLGAPPPVVPPVVSPLPPPPPARAAASAPHPARPKPKARMPEPPPLPAPELRLTVDTPSPDGPWTLHLDNAGSVPLRALADARLVAFEISAPEAAGADAEPTGKARKARARSPRPVRCILPAEMRARDLEERALVVPPGRSYVEKLDPRLFCFGAHDAAALVPGAKVVPHLIGTRETPAVETFEEVDPKVASAVDLAGAPATIGAAPPAAPAKEASTPQSLAVSTPAFAEVGPGWEAEVPTTVRAISDRSVALLFRPETVAFEVTGPTGVGVTDPSPTVRCQWPGHPPAPMAEAYTHLAPKQSASITILLDTLCPDDALRHPGLYIVRARLDTEGTSGASVGVRTFTGEVLAAGSTRLRVRSWGGTAPPAGRPQLVDLPAASPH
jgi:hypothetical protein